MPDNVHSVSWGHRLDPAYRSALRERLQARRLVLPATTGGSAFLGQRSVRAGCDQIADYALSTLGGVANPVLTPPAIPPHRATEERLPRPSSRHLSSAGTWCRRATMTSRRPLSRFPTGHRDGTYPCRSRSPSPGMGSRRRVGRGRSRRRLAITRPRTGPRLRRDSRRASTWLLVRKKLGPEVR